MRGRLLLALAVRAFAVWPVVAVIALVAPLADPLPGDPNPNEKFTLDVVLLMGAAVLLPVVGTASLLMRERWLRKSGILRRQGPK